MNPDDDLRDRIEEFIEASGGIDRMRQLQARFITFGGRPKATADFLLAISNSEDGSQQIVACALLGLTLAIMIHDAKRETP